MQHEQILRIVGQRSDMQLIAFLAVVNNDCPDALTCVRLTRSGPWLVCRGADAVGNQTSYTKYAWKNG